MGQASRPLLPSSLVQRIASKAYGQAYRLRYQVLPNAKSGDIL
ncbi:MAG TPA: hypothetical protein V6D14_04295 [Coleofasciculaceae cyanobacterium]|jgi:hypothetical protein